MVRGRKPTPTRLRKIRGNPGKRKPRREEAKPAPELVPCPGHLGTAAKAEWNRLAPELYRLGLLTRLDRGSLAALCAAWELMTKAEGKLRKEGAVIEAFREDKDGNLFVVGTRRNPWAIVWKQANEAYMKACAESRARGRE